MASQYPVAGQPATVARTTSPDLLWAILAIIAILVMGFVSLLIGGILVIIAIVGFVVSRPGARRRMQPSQAPTAGVAPPAMTGAPTGPAAAYGPYPPNPPYPSPPPAPYPQGPQYGSAPSVPPGATAPPAVAPPPPPAAAPVAPFCAGCGKPTTYVPQYGRYYCYPCARYV